MPNRGMSSKFRACRVGLRRLSVTPRRAGIRRDVSRSGGCGGDVRFGVARVGVIRLGVVFIGVAAPVLIVAVCLPVCEV